MSTDLTWRGGGNSHNLFTLEFDKEVWLFLEGWPKSAEMFWSFIEAGYQHGAFILVDIWGDWLTNHSTPTVGRLFLRRVPADLSQPC